MFFQVRDSWTGLSVLYLTPRYVAFDMIEAPLVVNVTPKARSFSQRLRSKSQSECSISSATTSILTCSERRSSARTLPITSIAWSQVMIEAIKNSNME